MFRASPAHHQEHATVLGASGLNAGEKRLERCWSWSNSKDLFSVTYVCLSQ